MKDRNGLSPRILRLMGSSDAIAGPHVDRDAFFAWLPDDLDLRVAVSWEGGRWFALAEDFDITGMGESLKAAVFEMDALLRLYLETYFAEGKPFDAARRPIPRRLKLQIRAGSAVSQVLDRIGRHREHPTFPRERRYLFAPTHVDGTAAG